jgi:catechol 2,3-dioxygenase-like lactoylglutathione lyase family enzyme
MKQATSFITLGVGDLARSRAFYRALGRRGYFADPDGFLREVCFNPFFTLDENEFVRLPE